MYGFVKVLAQKHDLDFYVIQGRQHHPTYDFTRIIKNVNMYGQDTPTQNYPTAFHRLYYDLYGFLVEPGIERQIAQDIDDRDYDVTLISHSRYVEAPHIFRFLKTPSVYLCPGPARQYYEHNLRIPDNLPLLNKIYEITLRYFRSRIDRRNTQFATAIATHSYFSAEAISMWYSRQSTVTYPGVNIQIFHPTKLRPKNQILVVGNPEHQKGIDVAINSLALLSPPRPTLVVASPRHLTHNPYRRLASRLKVKVIWKHDLSEIQMAKLYSQSYLTLAVSHREHFGCNALESLACGTPVIAVREGGYREYIDGKNGYLIDRDPIAIANKIDHLFKNPQLRDQMSHYAQRQIIKNWTWAKRTQVLDELLVKVTHAQN